jgi:hypothetical protein
MREFVAPWGITIEDLGIVRQSCAGRACVTVPIPPGAAHGNDPEIKPLWDAIYAANADVVINGHDHDYEGFAPQDAAGKPASERGIREFVEPGGKNPHRVLATPQPNSEFRQADMFGVLKGGAVMRSLCALTATTGRLCLKLERRPLIQAAKNVTNCRTSPSHSRPSRSMSLLLAFARTAAPESISRDAEVLVLGRLNRLTHGRDRVGPNQLLGSR